MSHQQIPIYNPSTDDVEDTDVDDYPVVRRWPIAHWGGTGDAWHQPGEITLRDVDIAPLGGAYLEAAVAGQPFLSILANEDQWGTWYTIRLTPGALRTGEGDTVVYAQEWGEPSFLRALAAALFDLADRVEPEPEAYRQRFVREETP